MREKYENFVDAGSNLDQNSNEKSQKLPTMLVDLTRRLDYRIDLAKQYSGFRRQADQVKIDFQAYSASAIYKSR